MTFDVISGKGAMVWRLREWEDGDPARQAAACVQAGLSWISIKVNDGTDFRWESESSFPNNQNEDLLPDTVAALREAGVVVIGWGYDYGRTPEVVRGGTPSISKAHAEAAAVVAACAEYDIWHYQIDAQTPYRGDGMGPVAEAFIQRLNRDAPLVEYSLCSYRYPLTHQPDFPVRIFAPLLDSWCPQVYFLEDNRADAGFLQTQTSYVQHQSIASLPYFPIFPTYQWVNPVSREPWRASYAQLIHSFAGAFALGLPAAGVWDLPQADAEQLAAIADFEWPEPEEPPPGPVPGDLAERIRVLADELGVKESVHGETVESFVQELLSIADELDT
jgi:hypothetical protein